MKTAARLRAPRALASAALVAVLTLTGCSTSPLDRAALIDGEVVSDSALHQAAADASQVYGTDVTPQQMLDALIKAPAMDAAALAQNTAVSDDYIRNVLQENGVAQPNDILVDFFRVSTYQQVGLTPDPAVLAGTEVQLNPRYGAWDPESASIVDQDPEWIVPAETAEGES